MSDSHCPKCNQTWCCHVGDGHDTPICPSPDVLDDKCPSCLIAALRLALETATKEADEREEKLHETNERLALDLVDAEDDRADLAEMYQATADDRDYLHSMLIEDNAASPLPGGEEKT